MLNSEELLTNDIDQLRLIVQERKDDDKPKGPAPEKKKDREKREKEDRKEKEKEREKEKKPEAQKAERVGPVAMDEDSPSIEVAPSAVVTLHGHDSEVYICAWSPIEPLLASGWVPEHIMDPRR